MKKLVYSCLLFWITGSAFSQTSQLKGTINAEEGVLSFANVILKDTRDSSIVKVEITDKNGRFSFSQIKNGKYFIEASYVGYQTNTTPGFNLNNDQLTLDPLFLPLASEHLDEVTVTAIQPIVEVKADKTVFNVENTLGATGTNGLELLRKAPGVILDNNNNIILEGKSGVQIFINNKPSPLIGEDLTAYLNSLQSSDIEAIEIITQPSSKYDAAGNAGIINIRLKKDKRLGTNGTVTTGYWQGRNNRFNSALSFNHRSRGANLFGNYSNSIGDSWNFLYLDRIQEGLRYNSRTETTNGWVSNNLRLGLDLFPGENHTIGVLFNGNFRESNNDGFTNTPISPAVGGEVEQLLIAGNQTNGESYNIQGNINYRFADTMGREILLDIDYGRFRRDNSNFQPNQYLAGFGGPVLFERNFRMNTLIDIDIFTAKADYEQQLFGGTFAFGAKYSNVTTSNAFDFLDVYDEDEVINTKRSNDFRYTENINAAYLNFNKKWKKWNLQLGLRVEQTISEGNLSSAQENLQDNVKRNYTNWFPSGGLTFKAGPKHSFALSYSRRIQRPNYRTLNPFETQLDELSLSRGNPFLQPQYTDNLKLSHTFNYRLTTSISYSNIQDFFARITDTLGSTRNFITTLNVADQEVWNLGISYPFDAAKWWSVYVSLNAYRTSFTSQEEKYVPIEQSTLSLYAQNTFTLFWGLKLEVSGWFSSPSVWGGTYLTNSMGSLNFALQKKFFGDKLSARLSFNDVLYTSPWVADMQFGDLYIAGTGGWESRNVRLNFTYSFGSKQVKSSRKRKTGLEEESKRVGN